MEQACDEQQRDRVERAVDANQPATAAVRSRCRVDDSVFEGMPGMSRSGLLSRGAASSAVTFQRTNARIDFQQTANAEYCRRAPHSVGEFRLPRRESPDRAAVSRARGAFGNHFRNGLRKCQDLPTKSRQHERTPFPERCPTEDRPYRRGIRGGTVNRQENRPCQPARKQCSKPSRWERR